MLLIAITAFLKELAVSISLLFLCDAPYTKPVILIMITVKRIIKMFFIVLYKTVDMNIYCFAGDAKKIIDT